jgi:hypothetical protein
MVRPFFSVLGWWEVYGRIDVWVFVYMYACKLFKGKDANMGTNTYIHFTHTDIYTYMHTLTHRLRGHATRRGQQ